MLPAQLFAALTALLLACFVLAGPIENADSLGSVRNDCKKSNGFCERMNFYYGFTGVKPELTGKTACAAYAETCKAFGAGEMKSGCSPHDNEKFVRAWCTAKVASGFNVSVTGQVGRDMHGILLIRHNRGDQDPRCMRLSDKWCFDEAPERPYSRIRA